MRPWLFIAGLDGALAVAMAAVGAHALSAVGRPEALFMTANRVHFLHALALLGVAALAGRSRLSRPAANMLIAAGALFVAGTMLFAGTLYVQALAGVTPLPLAAPTGGSLLALGWLLLAGAAVPRRG